MEDQFSCWGGGVDVLLNRDEGHPAPAQVLEDLDELLDRASGAVEALDDHDIELPLCRIRHESPEVGPIFPRPQGDVAIGRDQLPAVSVRMLPDLCELNLEVLPVGADTGEGRGVHATFCP